jgi:hypothetical protein
MRRFRNLIGKNSVQEDIGTDSQIEAIPNKIPPATQTTNNAAASTEEVLSTSELLSLIFQYLPPSLLVRSAKRVCRTWYTVLSTPSPDLQVSLFLRPAPEDSPLFTQPTFNDLLTLVFPFWLLNKKKLPRPGICSCTPNKCGPFTTSASITVLPWKQNPSAWQRKPSWRQMLVLQPPCTEAVLTKTTGLRVNQHGVRNGTQFAVNCPGGLTMGVLYDIVEGWIREAKDGSYISEYREKKQYETHAWNDFDAAWERSDWNRKELHLRDKETGQLLFLHLDLDQYSLDRV